MLRWLLTQNHVDLPVEEVACGTYLNDPMQKQFYWGHIHLADSKCPVGTTQQPSLRVHVLMATFVGVPVCVYMACMYTLHACRNASCAVGDFA